MKRFALGILLAGLAIIGVVSGCQSPAASAPPAGGAPMGDYATKVKKLYDGMTEKSRALESEDKAVADALAKGATPEAFAAAAKHFEKVRMIGEGAMQEWKSLTPPAALAAFHELRAKQMAETDVQIGEVIAALKTGKIDDFKAAVSKLAKASELQQAELLDTVSKAGYSTVAWQNDFALEAGS